MFLNEYNCDSYINIAQNEYFNKLTRVNYTYNDLNIILLSLESKTDNNRFK